VDRTKFIFGGLVLGCLLMWLVGSVFGQDGKKADTPTTQPAASPTTPRYQFHPGRDDKDMFFVFDTTTGHTWGYTARGTFGYRWVDYGTPGKEPNAEGKK